MTKKRKFVSAVYAMKRKVPTISLDDIRRYLIRGAKEFQDDEKAYKEIIRPMKDLKIQKVCAIL